MKVCKLDSCGLGYSVAGGSLNLAVTLRVP
jgi:hypothetical protein